MIYHIDTTTSTNDDARESQYHEGDIVWAEHQTKGRGQRGHTWTSLQGLNLTFSVVLEPQFLPVGEQFLLSEVVALSLLDLFQRYGIECRIKWTNDIYFENKKLVGILIEHNYSGQKLSRTIVGIGINVNQTQFDASLPNPVSMALIRHRDFSREEVLAQFEECLSNRYEELRQGDKEKIQRDYIQKMYRRREWHNYRLPSGEVFEAQIEGVLPSGELQLLHRDSTHHEYLFREVEFIL